MMPYDRERIMRPALQIVGLLVLLGLLFLLAAWFETWRAEVWAEAMSRHGLQGVPLPTGVGR